MLRFVFFNLTMVGLLVSFTTAFAQTYGQRFAKHNFDGDATFCVANTSPVSQSVQHIKADKGQLLQLGTPLARLQVHKDAFIDNLSALRHGDALFFVFTENFGGSGQSKLCKTSADGKTLLWCKLSGSINAELTAHRDAVYVTSVGSVAKFDAKTGKTLWDHSNLYDKNKDFDSFRQPQFEGPLIKFYSARSDKPPFRLATVDDATGKVVLSKVNAPLSTLPPDYTFDKSVCTAPSHVAQVRIPSALGTPPNTSTITPPSNVGAAATKTPLKISPDFFAYPIDCAAYDKPHKDILHQHIFCAKDRLFQVMYQNKRFDLRDKFSVNTSWAEITRICKRFLPHTEPHSYSCQDATKSWLAIVSFAERPNPNIKRGEVRDVFVWIRSISYVTCASPDREAEFQKVYRRFGKPDYFLPAEDHMIYYPKDGSERMKVTHTNEGSGGLAAMRQHPNPRARVIDYSDIAIACPGNYSLEFIMTSTVDQYTAMTDYFKSLERIAAQDNKGKF